MNATLVFEFLPGSTVAGTTVTAKIGDDVIEVDKFDPARSKLRENFVDRVCQKCPAIDREQVQQALLEQAAEFASRQQPEPEVVSGDDEAESQLQRMPEPLRGEARRMLESPDLLQQIIADIASCGVAGERDLVASIYLVGTSRLLDRPLAAIVQAPSSTGKSYVVEKVAAMFPREAVIQATAMTAQSLYYLESGSLCHRFVVAGERSRIEDDTTAEATRALREMISSGRLSKLVTVKEVGGMTAKTIEQEGPIAYVETTTLTKIFDEDANRCLLLSADERQQQTEKIIKELAARYAGGGTLDTNPIVQKHYALQRMIKGRPIVIPYSEKIGTKFDTGRVEARRAFPHVMSVIGSSALLHQFQRDIDEEGRVVASIDDYAIAQRLLKGPLARLLGGQVSDAALRFFDWLVGQNLQSFTTTQASKGYRKTDQAVRGWLHDLSEAGAVEQIEPPRGSRPAVWSRTGMDRDEIIVVDCGLPAVEEIQ